MSSAPPRDDRPEHIHMVVCGIAFFSLYGVLRVLHWNHPLASLAVLLAAFPLMYAVLPVSAQIYIRLSKSETRPSTVHVADAGCSTLIFVVFALLAIGAVENRVHSKLPHQSTPHRR